MSKDSQGFVQECALADLRATDALGARIAAVLQPGDLVALKGDLGAGKTTLARSILASLGVTENVPSPTFTLVQEYATQRLVVRHFDLYRLNDAGEVRELGLDDALLDGAAIVEWPEKAEAFLPVDRLQVDLWQDQNMRHARLTGPTRWRPVLCVSAHAH